VQQVARNAAMEAARHASASAIMFLQLREFRPPETDGRTYAETNACLEDNKSGGIDGNRDMAAREEKAGLKEISAEISASNNSR